MRYLALATDYDGTLATDGRASMDAIGALRRLKASGRQAILASGRRLDELLAVFPEVDLFDSVVAENGAVVYFPHTKEKRLIGKPPPAEFLERLRTLGVAPIEVGDVVVATWVPNQVAVLQAIQETGLELHIVFNKNAVMILPPGVNKATGLSYALRKLGLSFHEVVGVGDAENDHSFLERCECSVAVANAAPSILQLVDFVVGGKSGRGVVELVNELIADDLFRMETQLQRNLIPIGLGEGGTPVKISPYGTSILIAGPSGSGKTTVTSGIVERLIEQTYQVCIVDPEGDYGASQEVIWGLDGLCREPMRPILPTCGGVDAWLESSSRVVSTRVVISLAPLTVGELFCSARPRTADGEAVSAIDRVGKKVSIISSGGVDRCRLSSD